MEIIFRLNFVTFDQKYGNNPNYLVKLLSSKFFLCTIKSMNFYSLFISIFVIAVGTAQNLDRQKQFNLDDGLALKGYDPVAYFTTNRAVEGSEQYVYTYQSVQYYFSSAANRDLFKANPSKYEPQYGGWCAYALSVSPKRVDIDPESFKIIGGKLYLFYSSFIWGNTLNKWNAIQNDQKQIQKANNNYKKLK